MFKGIFSRFDTHVLDGFGGSLLKNLEEQITSAFETDKDGAFGDIGEAFLNELLLTTGSSGDSGTLKPFPIRSVTGPPASPQIHGAT